ncbi:MAG: hypothetical protein IKZ35_03430 [Clostridia bacterium]|nr:hypothetical protein [Oscillospiraceae bacterium]MBR4893015.1 hypothetical protein [Clostridia bacterium]
MTSNERREKWENYWYHYKWHTWLGIFAVFCVVFTIFEFTTHKKIDFNITYIGDYMNGEGLAKMLETEYSDVIGDINNDGLIRVEVNNIYTRENVEAKGDLQFWQRVDMDLVNAESYIYLVDEHILEQFISRGANGVIKTDKGYKPYIDVTENEILKPYLPKDKRVYLCVRKYFENNNDEMIKRVEEKSLELIEKIMVK